MQHNRLQPRRHLDRADGVAAVDNIRRIRARAKRLFPWFKAQRATALEAIADTVRFGTHGPRFGEKTAFGGTGQALVIQARHHTQGDIAPYRPAQGHGQTVARPPLPAELTDGQFITLLQAPTFKPTKRAQGVSGATAEHHRHINAAGHRQVSPCAGLGKFETQHLPGTHLERGVLMHHFTVKARRHERAAECHQRILLEFQFRPDQGAFQARRTDRIAHQMVGRAQRVLVQRPRRRNAQVVITFAAKVLHRGGEAGFEDFDHASASCRVFG